jgi:hypothetical protein
MAYRVLQRDDVHCSFIFVGLRVRLQRPDVRTVVFTFLSSGVQIQVSRNVIAVPLLFIIGYHIIDVQSCVLSSELLNEELRAGCQ